MNRKYLDIKANPAICNTEDIPVLPYHEFNDVVSGILAEESNHCLAYFAVPTGENLQFYIAIADDTNNSIILTSFTAERKSAVFPSLAAKFFQLHGFEREIHENYGIQFEGHPWLKPVRFPFNRYNQDSVIENYPFYSIESEELHEVGVGPVHAGVIEPGHFRFICNGEKVRHLEIQLGYQHRGIEHLMLTKNSPLQRCILAENIAGDTAVGHALAHAQLIEILSEPVANETLHIERCIALEMERIAVHIGDTAALCGDVAYQLGQVVCEALRTTVINTTQLWCGNRFGKSLIRPGGSNFPLTEEVANNILKMLEDTGRRYVEMTDRILTLPSVLARFEDIGTVSREQALKLGLVGMAARSSGLLRDIRISHPFQFYRNFEVHPVYHSSGDVLARALQRKKEVEESIRIIQSLITRWKESKTTVSRPVYHDRLRPSSLAVSLTEGWRGEICHVAMTNAQGEIQQYKIKDASFHNWMALALAVRNQEISDFPLCNKSYNLSYCGHD
ncbi:MAG TPA: NADH-quinone oxidoreductase subunit C, partial [Bacteroidales bacterium]|nr:NADH-quinone oxidoreductase subunit C [Bacteroidales bacterium]